MSDADQRLAELRKRVEELSQIQERIERHLDDVRREIDDLARQGSSPVRKEAPPAEPTAAEPIRETVYAPTIEATVRRHEPEAEVFEPAFEPTIGGERAGSDLEKFIGENLIAKIGVGITVIGVAIGAKYAIDQGWITPVMRIVFGYLIGIGLLIPAYRLREKLERFSAVLLSGAMAVFYFISYAAYAFYGLIPQPAAFVLMVVFTAFTVFAAVRYNRVVIAHIGLVGAYAVPFLLSENEGRIAILFSYVLIINAGILIVSLARYWRSLFYASFIITWLIYLAWYDSVFNVSEHFSLAFGFAAAFFAVFYATFLAWKVIAKEPFGPENVALVLANSFAFFGIGYSILNRHDEFSNYLGLFTIANAAIHFLVAVAVFRFGHVPASVVNLLIALVITFITIAIPVQLKGHWITLVWIAESVVLFTIGRMKRIPLYEWFAYPLTVFGTASLFVDWIKASEWLRAYDQSPPYPVLNVEFLTTTLYLAGALVILYVGSRRPDDTVLPEILRKTARILAGAVVTFVAYNWIRIEIGNYWDFRMFATAIDSVPVPPYGSTHKIHDQSLPIYNRIAQIDYSMLFVALASFVNYRYFRGRIGAVAGILFAGLFLLLLVTVGFASFAQLRDMYLESVTGTFNVGAAAIGVRYVSYACVAALLAAISKYVSDPDLPAFLPVGIKRIGFGALLHLVVLACLSSELLNLTDIFAIRESEKLGLSILWGAYALFALALGIAWSQTHLRIGALGLFAVTLLKVVFYDLDDLGTLARTAVFVSLGLLMLVAGYFYNKFANVIFKTDES